MSAPSVSRKQLVLEIQKRTKLSCDLKRHLSPKTVGIIMRSLPLDGHAHWLGKNIIYFESKIDSGIERAKIEFKKGDVAFLPSTGGVCFFLADTVFAKSMTPIGRLDGDIDVLKQTKSGDVLCIYEDTI